MQNLQKINIISNDKINFPSKLLLTNRRISCSESIKNKISKIVQSSGILTNIVSLIKK